MNLIEILRADYRTIMPDYRSKGLELGNTELSRRSFLGEDLGAVPIGTTAALLPFHLVGAIRGHSDVVLTTRQNSWGTGWIGCTLEGKLLR